MQKILLLTAMLVFSYLAPCVFAADPPSTDAAATPSTQPALLDSYVVRLVEIRTSGTLEEPLTAENFTSSLEKLKQDGKVALLESIRVSAIANQEAMAQFGKSAAITVGTNFPGGGPGGPGGGRGPMRVTQERNMGTIVKVTVSPQAGKLLVKLVYEASRFEDEKPEDRPPAHTTTHFASTLVVGPGKTILVGGQDSEKSSTVFLTVDPTR